MFTNHEISSHRLSTPRKAVVCADDHGRVRDWLIFLDGELYTDRVNAPGIIQAAQAAGRLPAVNCLYVPNADAASRHVDHTCHEDFAAFVAMDLPHWIEQETGPFGRLVLCGLSLSGLQAAFTSLRHPGVFSGVLSQSPSAWWSDERLAASQPAKAGHPDRFWMSVGTQETQENVSHPPTGLFQKCSQLHSVRRLVRRLADAGHEIHLNEYEGGHDPACWGAELPHALAWLLRQ